MRAALYARVSTIDKDQDPEVQLLQLRRYAQANRLEVVSTYIDFCSGKTPNRPGLKKMEADARARKFDAVLILRIDRIMRSVRHFYSLNDVLELHGVKIISITDGLDYSTAMGKLFRGILLHVAEFEAELLRERTLEGLEKAREDGKVLGRPTVEVDLDRFLALIEQPGISKAKACKMLGYSPGTVNNRLREIGREDLIGKPTRRAAEKGSEKSEASLIYKPSSEGIDNNQTFVAGGKGGETTRP